MSFQDAVCIGSDYKHKRE